MAYQISMFPDVLGTEIEQTVKEECERTKSEEYDICYIKAIRSLHEGYGYAAEEFSTLTGNHKRLKDNLTSYLNVLSIDSEGIDSVLTEIYGNAQEVAKNAVRVAAIAKRIMEEVRFDEGLPPEAYGESDESPKLEFEETE